MGYYLSNNCGAYNGEIFTVLTVNKRDFIENLGIDANCSVAFPETKSLEALTAIVSALFKEYEKQNELPKTWEEFCARNLIQDGECYIGPRSNIESLPDDYRSNNLDRNVCTSESEAKAFLALMQLRQLRKAYVKDWEPDWTKSYMKWAVYRMSNKIKCDWCTELHHALTFPTIQMGQEFLKTFRDLIEEAKILI